MSSLEDIFILDEIRALEDCLARNVATAGEASTASIVREDAPGCSRATRAKLGEQIDESARPATSDAAGTRDSGDSSDEIDILAALETNKKLIEALKAAKGEFSSLLDKCRRNQELVEERQKPPSRFKCEISNAGMPYFRDKYSFFAPRNADSNAKVARGELQVVNLPRVCRWLPQNRIMLERAIRQEVTVSVLEGREKRDSEDAEFLSGNLKKMVGPLGSREFDWLKIAATDFEMNHTANECRVMWNIFLHPDINKQKWSKKEDSKLIRLAKKHKSQDWQRIASDLGTKRTGYQCFIRYNTKNRNDRSKERNWTKRDDDRMRRLVSKIRIGDFIHWGEVAKRMNCRTKQQVYVRWTYSLAPHLKKGRFTAEEDKALLDAVAKYGKNFRKIASAVLPCRSSVQLNNHYQTLLAHDVGNVWSVEDDAKLQSLYHELGAKWSKIATYFLTKNRTQVRHRYTAIQWKESEGIALPKMRREYQENLTASQVFSRSRRKNESSSNEAGKEVEEPKVQELVQRSADLENVTDVDQQLLEYFKGIPAVPAKRGRKQEYYAPHELDDNTKKLYAILRTLNANLDIPDELDDLLLSQKDQQLLTSLMVYPVNETKRRKCTLKNIENLRQKMFGDHHSPADTNPDDHFIPSPSFSTQTKTTRCKRNKRTEKLEKLDYTFLHDNCDLLVETDDELETPENVTAMIGGEEGELEFRKIREMMIRPSAGERSYGREQQPVLQRVYILPPKALAQARGSKDAEDRAKTPGVEQVRLRETHEPLPTASGSPSTTKGKPVALTDSTLSFVGQVTQPWESSPAAMEPNYSTLLGFRSILMSKLALDRESFKLDDDDYEGVERFEITRDEQLALMLLKERLTKLFKLPICMSEAPPPEVHEESPKDLFKLDSTTKVTTKRKITNKKDAVVKRKRIKLKK